MPILNMIFVYVIKVLEERKMNVGIEFFKKYNENGGIAQRLLDLIVIINLPFNPGNTFYRTIYGIKCIF